MTGGVDADRWRRVEQLLDAALALPPEERPAYVEEACGSDAALHGEVTSLLKAHGEAGSYLHQPVGSVRAAFDAPYGAGDRIGPYHIVEKLGQGGLGVVYLAEDTRLDRKVALKLLLGSRVVDPESRSRFEREAKAASGLDHPNICTVYEIGESEAGHPFIAMRYVEGETLAAKTARGPCTIEQAVDWGSQVARGLAFAHSHGIIHRDIKPANLIVTPANTVMIVDFGLAKWKDAPTLTRAGAALGTVAYMSPEQLRGDSVDARSDIWSLGVVLYEMISGQRPFRYDHDQALALAILSTDPQPLTALRAGVPLGLESVVAKALAKNPDHRYQHADELPVDLSAAIEMGHGVPGRTSETALRRHRRRFGAVVAVGLAGVVAGAALTSLLGRGGESEPGTPIHLSLTLPPEAGLVGGGNRPVALSPDGTRLVYASTGVGEGLLHVRELRNREGRSVPGTEGARDPFFSPDGRWVGFFADGALHKVSLGGGVPQRVSAAPTATNRGASWGPDGTIVLPLGQTSGLFRVSSDGGEPEQLTWPPEGQAGGHFFPQHLPNGEHVLFTVWDGARFSTAVVSLETGTVETIAEGCNAARYVHSGHLVCPEADGARLSGNYLVAPFDLSDLRTVGSLVPLSRPSRTRGPAFAVSESGTLVYAGSSGFGRGTRLTIVDRQGRSTPISELGAGGITPSVSPDGAHIALTRVVGNGELELWLYETATGTRARLSRDATISNLPVWWPDGERILYNSGVPAPGLYSVARTGGEPSALVVPRHEHIQSPGAFTPDGTVLLFTEIHERTLGDIWTYSTVDGGLTPLIRTPANERTPSLSPDGRWLAYASDESGRDDVYVRPFPGPGAPIHVSGDGGQAPVWSRDGRELFYRRGSAVVAVPVDDDGTIRGGRATELFDGDFQSEYLAARNYDVLPDGRFVMIEYETSPSAARLDVVLNWFEEVRGVAPLPR